MFKIERIFKDNDHYNSRYSFIGNPYVKGISWLFDSNCFNDIEEKYSGFCLEGILPMYDFMCCVDHFIWGAVSEFPKQTLKDHILKLSSNTDNIKYGRGERNQVIPIKCEETECVAFSNMDYEFIADVIWCSYIYWLIISELEPDKDKYKKAYKVLFFLLREHIGLTDETFKEHLLCQKIKGTVMRFLHAYQSLNDNSICETPDIINSSEQEKPEESQHNIAMPKDKFDLFLEAANAFTFSEMPKVKELGTSEKIRQLVECMLQEKATTADTFGHIAAMIEFLGFFKWIGEKHVSGYKVSQFDSWCSKNIMGKVSGTAFRHYRLSVTVDPADNNNASYKYLGWKYKPIVEDEYNKILEG